MVIGTGGKISAATVARERPDHDRGRRLVDGHLGHQHDADAVVEHHREHGDLVVRSGADQVLAVELPDRLRERCDGSSGCRCGLLALPKGHPRGWPFLGCARQGALTWRCKSSTSLTGGMVSRTARVSRVTGNLEEAVGKALARRTVSGCEATCPGEAANLVEARTLSGRTRRRSDAHKREGECAIPGEICRPAREGYRDRKVARRGGRSQQRA